MHIIHLCVPRHSLCWLCQKGMVAGVSCIFGGEMVSGCEPAGLCKLSMSPGRHGEELAACSELGRRHYLCGQDTRRPLASASCCHTHFTLPPWQKGCKRSLTWSPFVFSSVPNFVLWAWQGSLCGFRAFLEESVFLFWFVFNINFVSNFPMV